MRTVWLTCREEPPDSHSTNAEARHDDGDGEGPDEGVVRAGFHALSLFFCPADGRIRPGVWPRPPDGGGAGSEWGSGQAWAAASPVAMARARLPWK